MMKILHIITNLGMGGAEMMLYKLLRQVGATPLDTAVVSLRDNGSVGRLIEGLGVPVLTLGVSSPIRAPQALAELRSIARRFQPDVIQGWMYHSNLAATMVRNVLGRDARALWNVRQSLESLSTEHVTSRGVILANAALSRGPACVIYNSETAARQHQRYGFKPHREEVIPNGFDCNEFTPSVDARATTRARLGIPDEVPLIGLVGRNNPQKDPHNFIRAARRVAAQRCDARFVIAGRGMDSDPDLIRAIAEAGLAERFTVLGEWREMPGLYNSLDVFVLSSSHREAFPNVVGEAMACGLPCVVTDVGDSRIVVGDAGRVVPRQNDAVLADAITGILALAHGERASIARLARKRVVDHYSLDAITRRYVSLYEEVLGLPCEQEVA